MLLTYSYTVNKCSLSLPLLLNRHLPDYSVKEAGSPSSSLHVSVEGHETVIGILDSCWPGSADYQHSHYTNKDGDRVELRCRAFQQDRSHIRSLCLPGHHPEGKRSNILLHKTHISYELVAWFFDNNKDEQNSTLATKFDLCD